MIRQHSSSSLLKVWLETLLIAMTIFMTAACDRAVAASTVGDVCQGIGICDVPPTPPVQVDILCDRSKGSTCTLENLSEVIEATLKVIAERPGSHVRLWRLGKVVEDTEVVGDIAIPPAPSRGSERARHALMDRFLSSAREHLLAAISPSFRAKPVRRTPLAESLTKMASTDSSAPSRDVIVVGDARQVSQLADFECGYLPTDSGFVKKLGRLGLLTSGSLKNTTVQFAFVTSSAIPDRDCPISIDRERRIRELWTSAMRVAGALSFEIHTGLPSFQESHR